VLRSLRSSSRSRIAPAESRPPSNSARERAGNQFDPDLAELICAEGEMILEGIDDLETWDAVIDAEPTLAVVLSWDRFDAALVAIANFVDLESPYTLGHSRAVADLAAAAGAELGFWRRICARSGGPGSCTTLAGWGSRTRSGTSADRSAQANGSARLHPYLTERMLQPSAVLAPLGAIAVQHRERVDGSGYPRGLSGPSIPRPARVLGAADAYQTMREPRPHRPERSADEAAAELRADVRAGRLDADAAEAVLGAAGHRVSGRREGQAGLTAREVDVLRLLARGLSNKQIAKQLVISPKTAGNHIEHIYSKIGASTRARASLFAMQHGPLPEEEFPSVAAS
jgi:DNA-binding CsgD family transcriptional regulator